MIQLIIGIIGVILVIMLVRQVSIKHNSAMRIVPDNSLNDNKALTSSSYLVRKQWNDIIFTYQRQFPLNIVLLPYDTGIGFILIDTETICSDLKHNQGYYYVEAEGDTTWIKEVISTNSLPIQIQKKSMDIPFAEKTMYDLRSRETSRGRRDFWQALSEYAGKYPGKVFIKDVNFITIFSEHLGQISLSLCEAVDNGDYYIVPVDSTYEEVSEETLSWLKKELSDSHFIQWIKCEQPIENPIISISDKELERSPYTSSKGKNSFDKTVFQALQVGPYYNTLETIYYNSGEDRALSVQIALEYQSDGEWLLVPPRRSNISFSYDWFYEFGSGETVIHIVDLQNFAKLIPGDYRVTRMICPLEQVNQERKEIEYIYSYFSIE